MEESLDNLRKSNKYVHLAREYDITTTHHYVKFYPESEEHLDLLAYDNQLILYPYPLDREIVKGGDYYIDPDTPIDEPMPLYTTIEVDHQLPKEVPHEILIKLHNPEADEDYDVIQYNNRGNSSFIKTLVDESFRLTGNLDYDINAKDTSARRYTPSGTITATDNSLSSNVGIYGLKVRIRGGLFTQTRFTDSSGSFRSTRSYRRDVYYSFNFERYDFQIRPNNGFNAAAVTTAKRRTPLALNFPKSDIRNYYATIFRATFRYYYGDIKGLTAPPQNAVFRIQLKIRASSGTSSSGNGVFNPQDRYLGLKSAVKIYGPSRKSHEIYGTTIQELAHAAHWRLLRTRYSSTSDIVAESWASGVQWVLTSSIYSGYSLDYEGDYTGVVQDMIDSDGKTNSISKINVVEKVSGYTISQLERTLSSTRTWSGWKSNIKAKYNNATEQHLDALFDFWD